MSTLLHACIYDAQPDACAELQAHVRELNFVRLAAQAGSPEELAQALQGGNVNLIFFHLDPDPDPVVRVIEDVSSRYPDLAMIAVSHYSDP